jgi:hypothetical protein
MPRCRTAISTNVRVRPVVDLRLTQIRKRNERGQQTLRHPVPRFYFHLHNDIDVPDEEGVELADLEAARAHAVRCARVTFAEMAKDEGRVVLHHRIDIEDERGAVLDTVHFRDAVKVEA